MTKEEFQKLSTSYIYLDGATGSNLVKAGMPSGVCPEQWILEHRDVMLDLQKKYVEKGTDILYAPTFTANRVKLAEYGLGDKLFSMTRELVAITREAAASAEHRVYVAGDLTMTGKQLKPMGTMELEELNREGEEAGESSGCDSKIASLVAETEDGKRSYIIRVAPTEGISYARDIAEKYGVTYEMLEQMKKGL